MSDRPAAADDTGEDLPQCRICLDGPDPDLGRLIRPCLCSGTVSHVHLACLQRWRNTSANASSFFVCPQCHYRYRFARTKIVGLATNPVAIGTLSTILFTIMVYASSFLATALLSSLDDPSYNSSYDYGGGSSTVYLSLGGGYWTNPYTVGRDLVRAALRIIQDQTGGIFDPDLLLTSSSATPGSSSSSSINGGADSDSELPSDPSFLWRFVRRFILGLPVVGAASLIHMLFSLPLLGPIHWIARSRGSRGRGSSGSRDTAAVVIILLLAIGALRVIYKVYKFTESVTKRVLLRAEASILEVNS